MNLIGTYQISDLTVVNPIIAVRSVNDNIINKTCSIEVLFNIDGALINHSRNIDGFTYTDSWEDIDIENFVVSELNDLQINTSSFRRRNNTTSTEEITKLEEIVGTTQVESKSSEEESTIVNLSWYAKLILKIKSLFNF